jgi:sporulation protein YlmC with PRC-barrel domain
MKMLRSLKELYGYKILALDGEIGSVHDFYFDDQEWEIRYLVVDTGPWILGRKVLISPGALGQPDWMGQQFPVNLKRDEIENGPDIDTDKPVSRQQQSALHSYFNWPLYWATPFSTGPMPATYAALQAEKEAVKEKEAEDMDTHLRRAQEVIGYQIEGRDGVLGKVDNFIIDDENWTIRYVVNDTVDLSVGKKVLIAPDFWVKSIRFDEKQVFIDLTTQVIMDSPEFDPTRPLNREYEEVLYDFHGRPYYWIKR